ncbi:MAG TPA: hypothetical protein VJS12_14945 [Steroidobacteraceae bacterium]|nr:hypothetical protein [Steroidobacteraceae bacterium]
MNRLSIIALTCLALASGRTLAADPTTDPCSLLTADEVQQAIGKLRALPKQVVSNRVRMCDYELVDESVGLSVWLLPASGLDRARKEYPELTAVKDLSDAFIHLNERLGQTELYARKGNATLLMSVPTPDGDADARGDAARVKVLARRALARLP